MAAQSTHAYTHAMATTKSRCVWTMFIVRDEFVFPQRASFADLLRRLPHDVVNVEISSGSMRHDIKIECGTETDPETYVTHLPDWIEPAPKSVTRTAYAVGVHKIHDVAVFSNLKLDQGQAYILHYCDPCWKRAFFKKYITRSGVSDWQYNSSSINQHRPPMHYLKVRTDAQNSTGFRDFKRALRNTTIAPAYTVESRKWNQKRRKLAVCASNGYDFPMPGHCKRCPHDAGRFG
jgi:hypothetical protein